MRELSTLFSPFTLGPIAMDEADIQQAIGEFVQSAINARSRPTEPSTT